MNETLYKVLQGGRACHGGHAKWNLPKGKQPGKWMPDIKGDLVVCQNGYHLCRKKDLVQWLGQEIYIAEAKGELLIADNKVVARKARLLSRLNNWNERTARLFACDCATRALKKYSKNPDPRSIEMIKIARKYATGKADAKELVAARDAARDAALDTALDTAWGTAWDAARDAAWDAAWGAALHTAWDPASTTSATPRYIGAIRRLNSLRSICQMGNSRDRSFCLCSRILQQYSSISTDIDTEYKWQTRRLFEYLDGKRE